MTRTLVGKLLRDVRTGLIVVALLLAGFQCLWAKVTQNITEEVFEPIRVEAKKIPQLPFQPFQPLSPETLIEIFFKGPAGEVIRKLIGAEEIDIQRSFDLLTSGYVHPLAQAILCIWAIGRAAGAIAGEIDRGTMELLLAQPIRRSRVILGHLLVDLLTIPVVCLAMWSGTWLGTWLLGMIHNPREIFQVDPWRFGPGLLNVGALLFAVSGYTMWLSAAGRFRGRTLGLAVFLTLLQFLVNVIAQFWKAIEFLRPFTVFYYYQPQQLIIHEDWYTYPQIWQRLGVLAAVGGSGYLLAWWTFCKRDLPAPL